MPALTIGWEYLTGYAVATDPSSRERAEWPPHPGRVFMALAAAWFETGEDAAEGKALRWLETLGDPELRLPARERVAERSHVTVYVPVNDKAGPAAAMLQSAPAMTRSKQPRTFPQVHVGDARCYMHWPEADGMEKHRDALDRLCGRVTRIGHSSSLVRMWVANGDEQDHAKDTEYWEPAETMGTLHCRSISAGTLDVLPGQTQIPRIESFAEHVWRIEDAQNAINRAKADSDAAAKKAANQHLKQAKQAYEEAFGEKFKKSASPPPRLRPQLGLWTGYRRVDSTRGVQEVEGTHFDTDLLVLTQVAGPALPVVSTLTITRALRGAVMKCSGVQPVPQWVSGHQPDGSASDDESGHLACISLPFVGHEHADGHLLGVGLVFPRSLDRPDRGRVLGPLLMDSNGQPCDVELKLGKLGLWTVRKRNWTEWRKTLKPETWTAHPTGAKTWASVTPVVLDKFPKADRVKDRSGWTDEVAGIIAEACTRIGLPKPASIDIDTTCWHRGGPRAVGKRRPLRGSASASAALGDGFPFYPAKGTKASRPQVHVWLEFSDPVVGPILLGAGRYQGYGLLKPLEVR
ncbi:MAG: type I-U CRISPR-associated protein Csb2 [Phycisphaerae bacterium]